MRKRDAFYSVGGFQALTLSIVGALALAWGVFTRQRWAWWGSLAYLGALSLSVVLTFARVSYVDTLAQWKLPAREIGWRQGMPIQGYHLAVLYGLPLLLTLALTILSRQCFGQAETPLPASRT